MIPDVRLIDGNALRKDIHTSYSDDLGILEHIDNSPTIDAQPAKHGRFVFEKGDYRNTVDGYRCTSCGETYHTKVPYFSEYKFCPNCGAKMGGGDADGN